VTETSTNQGGGSGASSVTFYLSLDWIFDAADTPLNITLVPHCRRRQLVRVDR
jgi:hypothetical protein